MKIIDLDHKSTWPAELIVWLKNHQSTQEVENDSESFFALTSDWYLKAYHATRLLDEEVNDILQTGIQCLDRNLIKKKYLYASNYLPDTVATKITQEALFADESRTGQLHFLLTDAPFRMATQPLYPFLENWGGESIYYSPVGGLKIGIPAIVCFAVSFGKDIFAMPSLPKLFYSACQGPVDVPTTRIGKDIPPSQVLAVYTVNSGFYSRYPYLSRD